MNLLVDIGNTRVKWACADDEALFGHDVFSYTQKTLPELLERHWPELAPPEQVYLASVADASIAAQVCEFAWSHWKLQAQVAVTEKTRAGLRNAYDDVTAMGVDRWLAMLAAWSKHRKPLCVIDCGTALTVDVILGDGQHAGGFILPGLSLMRKTLTREAHGIRGRHEQALQLEFGRTTTACISNGFAFALVGLVESCAGKIREEQEVELLSVVTGGEAEQLLPLLPGHPVHDPHLVLQGLALVSQPLPQK